VIPPKQHLHKAHAKDHTEEEKINVQRSETKECMLAILIEGELLEIYPTKLS